MQQQEKLSGVVENITFQNFDTGFAVIQITDENGDVIDVVGPLAGSVPGEELVLAGRYVEHSQYGRQFEASQCVYYMPEEKSAVLKYLGSGALPGVGPAIAKRIVKEFGERSLEVLATSPEKLTKVRGISPSGARRIGERFKEMYGIREAMSALASLGLTSHESIMLYRTYQEDTVASVQNNPYLLCGAPTYVSFARADAIAGRMGLDFDSIERTRAAVLYTLRHNLQNGHTCLEYEQLLQTASGYFRIPFEQAERQLHALIDSAEAIQVEYDANYIYLPEYAKAEMSAAIRLKEMAERRYEPPPQMDDWLAMRQQAEGIRYAPLQIKAIQNALTHGTMVITGGPGTGKTTTLNAVLTLFEQQAMRVLLAAPTGRAAKRMTELTGRKATTIHRLLEAAYAPGSQRAVFGKNHGNPLRCEVLVLDEMSMVDALLFENVLDALEPGTRLVMVGDAEQLPSVGAGNVLKGILDSGVVPSVTLDEIFRQAAESLIVTNAHRIMSGEMPLNGEREDDFFFLLGANEVCQQLVGDLVARRLPKSYDFSPFEDIQVLCPGRRGLLGTEMLNTHLQSLLNPPQSGKPELTRAGVTFRQGDKVMQIKNNYDLPYTDATGEPGTGAFNGDIGVIESLNPKTASLTVRCEDRLLQYTGADLHELELAYAVTIHKSQGSEFEAVVIPLSDTPQKLQYRNLLYTAVTRAKQLCVIVGEQPIMTQMVHNDKRNNRFSCFAHFLKDDTLG